MVFASAICAVILAVVMVAVVVSVVVVVKVPVSAGVVGSMTVELLAIGVWDDVVTISVTDGGVTDVVVALECVEPIACFAEVLSDLVVEVLSVGVRVGILDALNIDVLSPVVITSEFRMPIPEEEFSC